MISRLSITAVLFFSVLCVTAQQQRIPVKWKFRSVNQVGLLQGEDKTAFQLQSVNGFQHSNFFIGLGTGLDYYKYKSVPLFADIRKYFGKANTAFFIYADAGIHFVWEKKNSSVYEIEKYYPGLYTGAGIGYKAGFKNGMGLLLSAGYSYKRVNDRLQPGDPCYSPGCFIQSDYYRYNLNRLLLQLGWIF
jgi:hypothetical protein